jgi:hypothetical protein
VAVVWVGSPALRRIVAVAQRALRRLRCRMDVPLRDGDAAVTGNPHHGDASTPDFPSLVSIVWRSEWRTKSAGEKRFGMASRRASRSCRSTRASECLDARCRSAPDQFPLPRCRGRGPQRPLEPSSNRAEQSSRRPRFGFCVPLQGRFAAKKKAPEGAITSRRMADPSQQKTPLWCGNWQPLFLSQCRTGVDGGTLSCPPS